MTRPGRRGILGLGASTIFSSCSSSSTEPLSLHWERLPDLPDALGGQFAGVHKGALMVAGGSYFATPPWDGGAKRWVDSVHVLTGTAASWQTFRLPAAFGYGGSVSTPHGFFVIGGGDSAANRRQVLRLRWKDDALDIAEVAALPVSLANCGAALVGETVYVVGGQESPAARSASGSLYSLDLGRPGAAWRTEAPLPGPARILPAVAAEGDGFMVASGADLIADETGTPTRRYLRDAWFFTPGQGWTELPAPPRIAVAAAACSMEGHILIFGGDDGDYARQPEPREPHPGFGRDVQCFATESAIWSTLSGMPAGLVTTTAARWNNRIVIPGGEDRPARRSAEVHVCRLMGARA